MMKQIQNVKTLIFASGGSGTTFPPLHKTPLFVSSSSSPYCNEIINEYFGVIYEQEMFTQHVEEKKELLVAIAKDRKLSDLPKITQVFSLFLSYFVFPFTASDLCPAPLNILCQKMVPPPLATTLIKNIF